LRTKLANMTHIQRCFCNFDRFRYYSDNAGLTHLRTKMVVYSVNISWCCWCAMKIENGGLCICMLTCCSNAVLLSYFVLAGPTILFFQENAGSILVVVDITMLGVRLWLLFHFIYLYLIRFNFFWRPWLLTCRYCSSPRNGSYNVAAVTMQCFHAFLQRVCIFFLDTLSFWFFIYSSLVSDSCIWLKSTCHLMTELALRHPHLILQLRSKWGLSFSEGNY